MDIVLVPCLSDNYAYLLHDPETGTTGVVDPAEDGPITAALEARGWRLSYILNTHHHYDHVGGNEALKRAFGATIIGPQAERDQIPAMDVGVRQGETFPFGSHTVEVIDTPAHTAGHISFYLPGVPAVFAGDTMFSMGCGRLFEGTAAQMWNSLQKLMALHAATRLYCGHEYTQSNARFALSLEPGNEALQSRAAEVERLRARQAPTLPSTIAQELATNPFLRPHSPEIRATLGMATASDADVFAEIRRRKDHA